MNFKTFKKQGLSAGQIRTTSNENENILGAFYDQEKSNRAKGYWGGRSSMEDKGVGQRAYGIVHNPSICEISENLDQSGYSTTTITNKKKMVSFDFESQKQEGEFVGASSKGLLKSSLKMIPNEIESSTSFLKPSLASSKVFGSSSSLLSIGSFKSGFSWLSGFGKARKQGAKPSSTDVQIKKYKQNLEAVEYKKQLYKDNIFCCSSTSVAYRSEDPKFKDVKWMRLPDLFKERNCVLYNKSTKNRSSIEKGRFQTLGLVGAINELRQVQGFVEALFQKGEISQYGIYCLKVRIHGNQKVIIIDDFIPVIAQEQQMVPAFLTVSNHDMVEFWPFLLQKAYAKLFNTYQSLMEPQSTQDWMSTMLGHQVIIYNSTDEAFREVLKDQSTEAHYIFFKDQDTWQYARLEPFMDQNQETRFSNHNKSTSLKVLSSIYPKVMVLNLYENFLDKIQSLKLSQRDSFDICVYKFELLFGANIDISVWQKDIKHFRGLGYKYSPIRLLLAMKEQTNEGYRWIASSYSEAKMGTIRTWASRGEYYLILMIDWQGKPFEMNVKLTSQVQVESLSKIDPSLHDKIIEETASDIAQRFGNCKQVTDRVCIYRLIDKQLGFLVQSIHNEHHQVIASVRKSYKVVGHSGGRLMALTKNIQSGSLSFDINPLKNIGTMMIARKRTDVHLLAQHK